MVTILNAACKHPETGDVVDGFSHGDAWMKMFPGWTVAEIAAFARFDSEPGLEGFVTNEGRFVSRQEALLIAVAARQANLRGGMLWRNDEGEAILISEATTYQAA